MEAAYAAVGVGHFAAWVHESDAAMQLDLERRGYTLDQSTRAMGMLLDDVCLPRPQIELGPPDWLEYLRIVGVPPGFMSGADPAAFQVLVARLATRTSLLRWRSTITATAASTTSERWSMLGGAAWARPSPPFTCTTRARGCQTASLQSTEMAERVYAPVGFRDLGRILEYVPRE